MEKLTLTPAEVAVRLGIGRNAAYNLIHREDFPALRVGKRWVVPVSALERWLENQAKTGEENSNGC